MTTYTLTVQTTLEGITAPLQIHGESMNEIRHAVVLLKEHGLLVETPDVQKVEHRENGNGNAPGTLRVRAHRTTFCKACGRAITFVATQNGKKMPMDVREDGTLGASHFSSCPDATKFRRGAA